MKSQSGKLKRKNSDDEGYDACKNTAIHERTIDFRGQCVRPFASGGYWLFPMFAIALVAQYGYEFLCTLSKEHLVLTVSACSMCFETVFSAINFLKTLRMRTNILLFCIPVAVSSVLFIFVIDVTWYMGLIYGGAVNFLHRISYIRLMKSAPKSFSFGEASIVVQGTLLFGMHVCLNFGAYLTTTTDTDKDIRSVMILGLFYLLIFCVILNLHEFMQKPACFYSLVAVLLLAVSCIPISMQLPIVILYKFISKSSRRIFFVCYYAAICCVLILFLVLAKRYFIRNRSPSSRKASTRLRKVFHLFMLLVYVPGLLYECTLLYVASGVALAGLVLLEAMRTLCIPPIWDTIAGLYEHFTDIKDAGPIAVTPFALLVGCSLPLWITECPCAKLDQHPYDMMLMLSGVITIGIGDSMASIIGSLFGQKQWPGSHRTLLGSLAYFISCYIGLFAIYRNVSREDMVGFNLSVIVTMLIEAYTNQIDNLALPFVYYIIMILRSTMLRYLALIISYFR